MKHPLGSATISVFLLSGFALAAPGAFCQQGSRVDLGRLQSGAQVAFTRSATGEWGIQIAGGPAPGVVQPKPAGIEVYPAEDDIRDLSAGYRSVRKSAAGIEAESTVADGMDAAFQFHDKWAIRSGVLSVERTVTVKGNETGGFFSSIAFTLDPSAGWKDINFMIPGAIYGDPTYGGDRSPGGTLNYEAHNFQMREDIIAAPLIALSFANGASIAMLDPAPRGDTTEEESTLIKLVMTDSRFQFGALGVAQPGNGPIEIGFRFPGTVNGFAGPRTEPARPRWMRRYHPIREGFSHHYEVEFRFGRNESFRDVRQPFRCREQDSISQPADRGTTSGWLTGCVTPPRICER